MPTIKECERMIASQRKRLDALEDWRDGIEEWRKETHALLQEVKELTTAAKEISAALRLFVKIGDGAKWFLGVGSAIIAACYAFKTYLNGE